MMNQRTKTRTETQTPKAANGRARIEPLVREEFSRKSFSYFLTAIMALVFGFIIMPGFSTAVIPLEASARSGGWLVDFFFLAIVAVLSVNVLSRNYFLLHKNPFSGWLTFLRSLPVSPKEIVLARSLIMLPATLVMTAIFFTPIVSVSWFLMDDFGAGQFFWFALVWLGYALFTGGMNLLLELGVKGNVVLALQFAEFAPIIAVVWLSEGNLVYSTFVLAGEYGPLAAGISLLAGGAIFAAFAKATERRVAKREFVV